MTASNTTVLPVTTTAEPTTSPVINERYIDEMIDHTQRTLALRPVDGTLTEKIAAFKEMANAFAQMRLNGWDDTPKCLVACWLSDGLGMHPALFMQNNWVAKFKGDKIVVMPQWPFMLALVRSRVPNFKFKLVIDEEDKCSVWMTNGRDEHTETYTLRDAQRQGLVSLTADGKPDYAAKDWSYNAWKGGNIREMLRAKVIRRCANIVAPEVMMGLPNAGDSEADDMPAPTAKQVPVPPEAPALERAAVEGAKADEPKPADWNEALRTELRARCGGGMTGKKMLEKANVVRADLKRDPLTETPTADQAREIVEHLRAQYPNVGFPEEQTKATGAEKDSSPSGKVAAAPVSQPKPVEDHGYAENGPPHTAGLIDNAIALDDSVPEPDPEPKPGAPAADPDESYKTVLALAEIAKKHADPQIAKSRFVVEAPAGSGQHHFLHGAIARKLGFETGIRLTLDGKQEVSPETCKRIVFEMRSLGIVDVSGLERHNNR